MDINLCTFVGKIGSNIKKGKTQNGEPYIGFLLRCEPPANANSSQNNQSQMISIRCFKPKVIKYLENVGAKMNDNVVVLGFVSSYMTEVKGKSLVANSINGNQIFIIKVRKD